MAPIAIAILIGLVAGALGRGRLTTLARVHLSRFWLLALAVACALGADLVDLPIPAVFAVVGLLAGIGFAASNLLIPGMAVVGIGVAVNLAPIALNGAMPVRADALVDAHIVAEADVGRVELSGARELADSDTILEILGDVIPLSPFGQVMSFGDLIVLVGLADVVANLMRARRPRRLPHGAAATLTALGWDMPPDDDIFIDLRASLGVPHTGVRVAEMKATEPSPRFVEPDSTTAPTWDSVSALSSSDT